MMKKLFLSSLAGLVLATGSSAFAADIARRAPIYKAPPPAPVVASWTGCYIDGGVGYGMWNAEQNDFVVTPPGAVPTSIRQTSGGRGWLGRLGGGCDYQVPGSRFVFGLLADYDFMNLHGQFAPGDFALVGDLNERSAWYAGGRIGYLVTPSLLTYVSGGFTQTRFDSAIFTSLVAPVVPAAAVTMPGHTYDGWFLGAGTEYALNFDWLPIRGLYWRTEYRFASYDSAALPLNFTVTGLPTGNSENVRPFVQTVTSSLVWRFNFGGPLGTRY